MPTTQPTPLKLAVVIPTFNESGNVVVLVDKLHATLGHENDWEIVFVDDDSPDGTSEVIRAQSAIYPRVRCLRRVGRRGLSSACTEGMLSSSARYFAIMDADLQHDETKLPDMLVALEQEGYDMAVGTRYMEGGSVGNWQQDRIQTSQIATWMCQRLLGLHIKDPMSGFFMLRREVLDEAIYKLSGIGFKLLVDLLASSQRDLRIKEIPFHFGLRLEGQSKLDTRVIWDYLLLLADKRLGRYIPIKLISFAAVGSMGVVVHVLVLSLLMGLSMGGFLVSQTAAVSLSMVFNFFVNNALTYSDKKLHGKALVWGLLKFMLVCSVGGAANVGVASWIYDDMGYWLFSGLAGILVGLIWNYAATSILVWSSSGNPGKVA
jgi:dolichol-phosphate mannosyltransferase